MELEMGEHNGTAVSVRAIQIQQSAVGSVSITKRESFGIHLCFQHRFQGRAGLQLAQQRGAQNQIFGSVNGKIMQYAAAEPVINAGEIMEE